MEHVKSMNRSKDLVDYLYNSISQSKKSDFDHIKEELLKVYIKLDLSDEKNIPRVGKIFHCKVHFQKAQFGLMSWC